MEAEPELAEEEEEEETRQKRWCTEQPELNVVPKIVINKSSNSNRSLIGVKRQKNGRYGAEVRDPIKKKRVWLGTFDTAEEASQAYFSKKSEFAKLSNGKQGNKPKDCEQSRQHEALSFVANDQKSNTAVANDQKSNTAVANNQTWSGTVSNRYKRSGSDHIVGVYERKPGKYTSEIKNPISKKKCWLGTFATAEEASQAYQAKKLEFNNLLKATMQRNVPNGSSAVEEQDEQEQPVKVKEGHETINTEGFSLESSGGASSSATIFPIPNSSNAGSDQRIVGVRKTKMGKYTSAIKNPISKKKCWLGTFATAEEASQAYQSKKLEFNNLSKATMQSNVPNGSSAVEEQDEQVKTVKVKEGHETINSEGFHPQSCGGALFSAIDVSNGASDRRNDSHNKKRIKGVRKTKTGKYTSAIKNPISKNKCWLGIFDTAEEASHAYQSKKLEFKNLMKAKRQSNVPNGSSAGEKQDCQEEEDLWMGQWVKIQGDREVKFSLKLGLPIIDNYGCLLGEFSSLDDLSIC